MTHECDNTFMRTQPFEWNTAAADNPTPFGWSDGVVLESVLAVYRECLDDSYVITGRPDQQERNKPAVDGVLTSSNGRPVAIEITALQTFDRQNETRSRYLKHLASVERALARHVRRGVSCKLPTHPLVKGDNWSNIAARLESYIKAVANTLEYGAAMHRAPGIPFEFWLGFDRYSPLPFYFERADPSNADIDVDLLQSFVKALNHKWGELQRMLRRGFRSALVITTSDRNFYRMTWDRAYRLFAEAEQIVGSGHAHDVLFAFTGNPNAICCMAFKADTAFKRKLNTSAMKFGSDSAQVSPVRLTLV